MSFLADHSFQNDPNSHSKISVIYGHNPLRKDYVFLKIVVVDLELNASLYDFNLAFWRIFKIYSFFNI